MYNCGGSGYWSGWGAEVMAATTVEKSASASIWLIVIIHEGLQKDGSEEKKAIQYEIRAVSSGEIIPKTADKVRAVDRWEISLDNQLNARMCLS